MEAYKKDVSNDLYIKYREQYTSQALNRKIVLPRGVYEGCEISVDLSTPPAHKVYIGDFGKRNLIVAVNMGDPDTEIGVGMTYFSIGKIDTGWDLSGLTPDPTKVYKVVFRWKYTSGDMTQGWFELLSPDEQVKLNDVVIGTIVKNSSNEYVIDYSVTDYPDGRGNENTRPSWVMMPHFHRFSEEIDHPDASVTTEKIRDRNVTEPKLDDNSISTRTIQDRAIIEPKLADNSVITRTILDKAVTEQKLDDNSVSTRTIQPYAVTEPKLADNSISTRTILDMAVTEPKLANNSVSTRTILDRNVTEPKLADNSVSRRTIQSKAIDYTKIDDYTIQNINLATGSVDSRVISAGAVGTNELADGAVTGAKIANHVVSTLKIYRHPFVVATPDGDTTGDVSGWAGLKSLIEGGFNGTIFLKTGNYNVTSTIYVPDATDYLHIVGDINVRLRGSVGAFSITTNGWKSIIFENVVFEVTGDGVIVIYISVPSGYGYYVRFSNCAFWGTNNNYKAQAIFMNGQNLANSRLYLDQCEFSHFTPIDSSTYQMIEVWNTQVFMTNCDMWTVDNTILYADNCECYVANCNQRSDSSYTPLNFINTSFRVVNNTFRGSSSDYGIVYLDNSSGSLIGNYLQNKSNSNNKGIYINRYSAGSYELRITGNYIRSSQANTIYIDHSGDSNVKTNIILNDNILLANANIFYENVTGGSQLSGIAIGNLYGGTWNANSSRWTSANNRTVV